MAMRAHRFAIGVLLMSLAGAGVVVAGSAGQEVVQSAQTPPPPPPRVQNPEQKALAAAQALKDPAEKLDALKKLRADFPKSPLLTSADSAMLDVLVNHWPERTDEIREVFDRVVKAAPTASPDARLALLQRPVTLLLEKKVLLTRAEEEVTNALEAFDAVKFFEAQIDLARRTKRPEPSASTLVGRYKSSRGRGLELLGRIYAERGDPRAEPTLKEALAAAPTSSPVALQLANLEAARGDETAALEHYLLAALGIRLKPVDDAAMMRLFRKHRGEGASLDEELDRIYNRLLPNPVTAQKWTPTPARTTRLVVAEAFTGSACGPCVSESLAFQALLDRYPGDAVALLAYHVHIPGPDPMTTSGSAGRKAYYEVPGVPTFNVDGGRAKLGGGGRENTPDVYADYVKAIDKALETAPRAAMALRASLDGEKIVVQAELSKIAPDARDLKLHVVLAERKLRFSGENGIRFHEMVVRGMAGKDGVGLPVDGASDRTMTHTFDLAAMRTDITEGLAAEIARRRKTEASATPREYLAEGRAMTAFDPHGLVVIAFLQDGQKTILQGARVDSVSPRPR